jgi:selT/selW/selH-like putative selenoprotein
MASRLLDEFERYIENLVLAPSRGGVFEVTLGDEEIYSKKATKKYPEYEEVAPMIRTILGRPTPAPRD